MKVQLLARPDHSLFLYASLKKMIDVRMLNFNVAKKGSLLHKLHPSAKLVDDEVVVLYDFILFNQLIFRLGRFGCMNPYKWEGKYANLSYGWRAGKYEQDLIHYWPLYCHKFVRNRREKMGVKTVADVYCAHPYFILNLLQQEYDKFGLDIKQSYFYKDAERSIDFLEHENNIITTSHHVKESFEQFNSGKNIYIADYGFLGDTGTETTYNAALEFQQSRSEGIIRMVYVGTVAIEKGVHYLLEAFKKLNTTQFQLDIIGDIRHGQEKIFQQYFSQEGVNFLGFKSNMEVKNVLKSYSALIMPSLSDAYSIAVVEGLQNALPVIVTENTGIKDAVEKFGLGQVVPIANSEALAEAMEKLKDLDYRRALSVNILNYIHEDAKYPYPLKVLDIYRTLLESKQPGVK